MKLAKYRSQIWFAIFALGFLVGIVYENLTYTQHSGTIRIFDNYFLEEFATTEFVVQNYAKYILKERMVPFGFVCILASLKWKKTFVFAVTGWTGFLLGVLLAAGIIWDGIMGFILGVAILLPHSIFYGFSYMLILWHLYTYPETLWNIKKTMMTGMSFFMGVVSEAYITPLFLKFIIKLF